ncbi:MAG TPA: Ppx/GppA phosphatase family protein [Microthrixaceae bacterium]|nr:Ppx/GppA family phosphatase [Microthrixaceae bacterium]HNI34230.1 Ppx/GppA phosphatase family protein [Microthrixaceae bacterium]
MTRYGAIDIGTNSVRLLIGDGSNSDERLMRITRLGRNVDATGRLDPGGIDDTLAVLREYRGILDRYELAGVRATATSAARDAANREDFFGPATEVLGLVPEVISGEEEAQLSFLGATAELDPLDGPFLVVDIGGGSTEFAVGRSDDAGGIRFDGGVSIDVGCVRMTERYLVSDPPDAAELSSCLSVLQLHWDDVRAALPAAFDAARLVGLAGTVVNMAAVEIGLAAYDRSATHHFVLTKDAAEDVFRTLATETVEDRKHNPGLDVGRADVIVGGACILVSIMRNFGFDECLVSESDILDGLILSQRS